VKTRSAWLLVWIMVVVVAASAAPLTGKVTNGTVNKPQGGDDVVLLALSQGMQETARTKTNASGEFKFDVPDDGGPHLVRVNHQGANYFTMVPPGRTTADVQVFDVAPKVDGIAGTVNIMRMQASGGSLQVTELYAVRNQSQPPRTQMSDQAFEINLPEGAQIEGSMAQGPGGQPINSAPVPQKEKGRYAFVFPLRPGETRFQVSYRLPYSGQVTITPMPLMTFEHLVLMLPASMKFEQVAGTPFQSMPSENGAEVRVSSGLKPGEKLAFKISGTGEIQDTESASAGQPPANGRMPQRGGPGGGLGAPEETPDPLHKYRWFILGGLAVALAVGAFWAATRQPAPVPAAPSRPPTREIPPPAAASRPMPGNAPAPSGANGNRILEALKEELFQLELDRHQGRISQEEYERARSALDVTIQRAAARASKS